MSSLIVLFVGDSLHWFFALKAEAAGQYHNVFDAVGTQSMCLWVDTDNKYEFNNCAGEEPDTLRSTVRSWKICVNRPTSLRIAIDRHPSIRLRDIDLAQTSPDSPAVTGSYRQLERGKRKCGEIT